MKYHLCPHFHFRRMCIVSEACMSICENETQKPHKSHKAEQRQFSCSQSTYIESLVVHVCPGLCFFFYFSLNLIDYFSFMFAHIIDYLKIFGNHNRLWVMCYFDHNRLCYKHNRLWVMCYFDHNRL